MIPELYIEQWKQNAPWVALSMVEQDLISGFCVFRVWLAKVTASLLSQA